jgi:hypothetical protein
VFDVELWDTSGEGGQPEQTARLAMLGDLLRAAWPKAATTP